MKRRKGGRNSNPNRRYNPRRGPPGMLFFCETGRESKCLGQGIDILNHYYDIDIAAAAADDDDDDNENENDEDHTTSNGINAKTGKKAKKVMTLEEEIQMMKTEKKKSPFQAYETGCRGAVFVMYTSKNCNIIVQQPQNSEKMANNGEDSNKEGNDEKETDEQQHTVVEAEGTTTTTTTTEMEENKINSKRKVEDANKSTHKKQKTEPSTKVIKEEEKEKKTVSRNWDPVQTIQSIVQDIRNNDATAPRSRFITKMIPIQATCFANMEEIKPATKSLLKHFLMPYGIKYAKDNNRSSSTSTSTNDKKGDEETKLTLPTFKIEFRRRFCSHMHRDEVIKVVADEVQTLTAEYWTKSNNEGVIEKNNKDTIVAAAAIATAPDKEQSKTQNDTQSNYPPLFGVDLKNPDYTVIIEICRTLCTMSVVKDAQSFRQFNLMMIQEEANNIEQ